MFCSRCGKQIPDGIAFCPMCGANLQPSGAAPQQPDIGSPLTGGAIYTQTPPPGGRFIPTDRSILVYIILSFVTCGIYGFYFVYAIARDMNTMCVGDGESTPGLAAYIALSIVTCGIYNLTCGGSIRSAIALRQMRRVMACSSRRMEPRCSCGISSVCFCAASALGSACTSLSRTPTCWLLLITIAPRVSVFRAASSFMEGGRSETDDLLFVPWHLAFVSRAVSRVQ